LPQPGRTFDPTTYVEHYESLMLRTMQQGTIQQKILLQKTVQPKGNFA
jgi:hypothetical protein